jgi:hypothetical protein
MIERHCPPTKFDVMPYKTVVKVFNDNGVDAHYIQLGSDDEMIWRTVESVFNQVFSSLYGNDEFIEQLLNKFHDMDTPNFYLASAIERLL